MPSATNDSPAFDLANGIFFDRIIRDDVERFFIERYIELNPLLWYLDAHNPSGGGQYPDDLGAVHTKEFGLTEQVIEWLAERGYPI